EGSVVLVAQSDIDGKITSDFPIVLDENCPLGLPQLREQRRRLAGHWIHQTVHGLGFVVYEIEDVVETVLRDVVGRVLGASAHVSQLAADFGRVSSAPRRRCPCSGSWS